jgi:hypothetical protein
LALTPAMRKEIPGIITIIGHVEVLQNDPDHRVLDFAPSPRSVSKFKRVKGSSAMNIPYRIYYGYDNMPLVDVLKSVKGELKDWPNTKYPEQKRAT